MLDKLEFFLEHDCEGLNLDPILVGVSGGPDSLCLLDCLVKAKRRVIVAHFNHQLRSESDQEAKHVHDLAQLYGLPFVSASQDVNAFASENGFSIEEAARKLRYRFLFAQAHKLGAMVIAVAHHADDQVETVLMHFLRGAGLSGLKGMTPVTLLPEFDSEIRLIRPLLRTWRKDIEAYCETYKLDTVEDLTNLDQTYFRNRLRHSLIPTLETYNPGFKLALLRSAESLSGDFQMLNEIVDDFWERSVLEIGEGFLAFNKSVLQAASPAILRNLFRRSASHLNSDLRDISFEAVERLVRYARNEVSVSSEIDFTDGNQVFIEGDRLFLARRSAEIPTPYWPQIGKTVELKVGKPLLLGTNWCLLVKEVASIDDLESIYTNTDSYQAWMDADLIQGDLQVRSRREGDRFQPLGMLEGSIKLSDYFINEKLPVRGRRTWPLVCLDNEILWIPGYRSAHPYRVTNSTRKLLHFELSKTSS